MKNLAIICILTLFTVSATAQVSNLDFENWHMDTTNNIKLDNWKELSLYTDHSYAGNMLGTWQLTNSYHGTYALKISRWYSTDYDHVMQTVSYNQKPAALSGYYIYEDAYLTSQLLGTDTMNDSALVIVALTNWDAINNKKDTIGLGIASLPAKASYTPFTCIINYSSSATPDSLMIHILPTSHYSQSTPVCPNGGACSYLTIDDLSLQQNLGLSSARERSDLMIFPNPASDFLYLDSKQEMEAKLINSMGIVISVIQLHQGKNEIEIKNLPPALYFIAAGNYQYKILKL